MENLNSIVQDNNRLVRKAGVFLFFCLLIFLAWSILVKIDSASISTGMIVVESKRKSIAHLEGGIVAQVYVHEGQIVKEGDPLVKLSDVSYISRLREARLTYLSALLKYQRLKAERDMLSKFEPQIDRHLFPDLSLEISTLMSSQQSLFLSRIQMRQKELDMLDSRLSQAKNKERSSSYILEQKKKALSFLNDEIDMHDKLLKDGYTSKLEVLELKRTEVLLNSDIISIQSDLDDAKSSVVELSQQRLAIEGRNSSDLEKELSDTRNQLLALESDLKTAQDVQQRTILKSPSNGIVLGLKVNAPGEVIQPGESIMEIIPNHDSLLVESLIVPTDIDSVHLGQRALVRLSAYNTRVTPIMHGEVIYVDADRTVVNEGNKTASGYKIKIKLDNDELNNSSDLKLYPGMPADVYVLLKEKRPIDYLIEPFVSSLFKAFRET